MIDVDLQVNAVRENMAAVCAGTRQFCRARDGVVIFYSLENRCELKGIYC